METYYSLRSFFSPSSGPRQFSLWSVTVPSILFRIALSKSTNMLSIKMGSWPTLYLCIKISKVAKVVKIPWKLTRCWIRCVYPQLVSSVYFCLFFPTRWCFVLQPVWFCIDALWPKEKIYHHTSNMILPRCKVWCSIKAAISCNKRMGILWIKLTE